MTNQSGGIQGLHHITLVSADAQRTVDFYTGTLGLRLVTLGLLAVQDRVCVEHDAAGLALPEDVVEPHRGHRAALDDPREAVRNLNG